MFYKMKNVKYKRRIILFRVVKYKNIKQTWLYLCINSLTALTKSYEIIKLINAFTTSNL